MAIYFFDKNQDLIKIVPESATFEATQTQELDEDSLLKDTLSVKVKGDERLLNAEYMAVKSYEGNDQAFDMYRIVTDTTPDKTMSFTGMGLAPYELNGHIIQDLRPANHTLEYTLGRVLNGTDWRLGHIDSDLKNVTTTFYYVSVKEALKELQSLVGCEFVFKVEISGQKITDKWVEVYRKMGNRTKKRFNYGTNALTVVRETNKTDIYTALIGRGKGEEVSSAEDNDSGQAGYGRKITFEDIEWSIEKGNPLDKPKGQYYLELPLATLEYGMRNVDGTLSPRIGIVEFNDEEDPANLLRLTYEQLKVSARPKVLFKSTVANIGATGIGDTVTIHRHDLNMHYETRVRKVVRNKLNDNKTQIELGDAVVTPSTKIAKQNNATIKNLKQELERAQQEFTETRLSADGKTNNHYGQTEPERKRTGDTWYRPHPSIAGETQMLTWDGNAWELILDTSDTSKVERELEEVIKPQIENMTTSIAETDNKANNALEKVDVNTNLISEHKKTLDDITLMMIPKLDEIFSDSLERVNAAIQDASIGLTEVRILAENALEKAQENGGYLTTVEETVDDLKGEISQKVTSAEVTDTLNTFNETVKTQTASQITESLTGYAKTGDLTTIAQNIRTETAESLKSVYTKTETDGLLGGMSQKINSVQKTADGNEALIAKIQETPETYLADYQKLINRADLFERTLGTTDSAVGENVSRMVQTSGIIQTEVAKMDLASGSEISTLQTQLADSWGVKIKSADEAISSINLTTTGPRLAGKIIELDGDTHVDGDFWAKEVNAIKVNADNITTGTLDGSRIRANSIDVNSLAGNRATLVSAGLISSSGGSLELNGDLILSTASDNSQVYIGQGILGIRNTSGATIGQFGYQNTGSSPITTIQNSWGTHFRIMMRRDPNHPTITNKEAFYITSGGTEMYLKTDDIYLNPSNRVNINSSVTISDELRMQGHSIVNPYGINFMGGGSLYTLSGGNETRLEGSGRLSLRVNGSEKMRLDTTHIYMYQTLNMQNNAIAQQSDERLKKNIRTLKDDDLEKIRQLRIVSYEWRDENKRGTHKGVIAQEFAKVYPELVDEVNGILSINSTELEMAKLHAIQQLDDETRSEIDGLKAQIASLQDELALLKGD